MKNFLLLAGGIIAIVQFTACRQEQAHYGTAQFQAGHLDILEASDVTVADVDLDRETGNPKVSDHRVAILKLRLQLTGDRTGRLTLRANQLCVETTKGEHRCNWRWLSFFSNAGTTGTTREIGAALLQIDGKIFSVRALLPDTSELSFAFRPGATSEAELLFGDVDKAQAASFHFGSFAAVRMKSRIPFWPFNL